MNPLLKEIGGYFEFERFHGDEYHDDLLRFDSVRSSFIFVIERRKYKKIYIPYYLCESIKKLLDTYNIGYDFYHINKDFSPIFNETLKDNECLFFVNYIGQFTNDELLVYKKKYENIFVDNTQSFFQKPVKEIDSAYSCKKYFGVSDGAYLNIDLSVNDEYENIVFDVSHENMLYVMGRFETSAEQYYQLFSKSSETNKGKPIKRMSRLTQNILKGLDYKRITDRRFDNINYLMKDLNIMNELEIKNNAGLFFYPLLIRNGNRIKRKLIQHKIYVPTLWPNVLTDTQKDSLEYNFVDNIVFIPIDHRYSIDDMKYILEILFHLIKEQNNG